MNDVDEPYDEDGEAAFDRRVDKAWRISSKEARACALGYLFWIGVLVLGAALWLVAVLACAFL